MHSAGDIISQLNSPNDADKTLVKHAYDYAAEAHKDHKRYSGEPYMTHTAAVGHKLAAMGMSPRTIAAGLLHDTIEERNQHRPDMTVRVRAVVMPENQHEISDIIHNVP